MYFPPLATATLQGQFSFWYVSLFFSPINTNWEDKRVSFLGEKLEKMVSPSRMHQSTSGGLQGGISFLYEAIAVSALVTLFFSSNINEINSTHLFLLLFTDHHKWSPGWAISSEIKTVMLTLIESSFGHFMTHVIEAKKDRRALHPGSNKVWELTLFFYNWMKLTKLSSGILLVLILLSVKLHTDLNISISSQEIFHHNWWRSYQ